MEDQRRSRTSNCLWVSAVITATGAVVCGGILQAQSGGDREECRKVWIYPGMHECRCWETSESSQTVYDSCERAVTDFNSSGYVKTYKCVTIQQPGTCADGGVGCGIVYNCSPTNCQLIYPNIVCQETSKGLCGAQTFGDCVNPVNP